MIKLFTVAILSYLVLIFAGSASAETVVLKTGQTRNGKIIERNDKYIRMDLEGVSVTYYLDEIQAIDGLPLSGPPEKTTPLPEKQSFELMVSGLDHASRKDFQKAEEMFRGAVKIYKENFSFKVALDILQDIKDKRIDPDSASLLFTSMKLIAGKNFKGAMEETGRALKANPDYDKAVLLLGTEYAGAGDYKKAVESYRKALELGGQDPGIYDLLGQVYVKSGLFAEASAAYKKVVELDPKNAQSYANLNALFNGMNDFKAALIYGAEAVKLEPENGQAYLNLGTSFFSLGRYQEAYDCQQKSVQLMPDYPEAYFNLAASCLKLKKEQEAKANLQKARVLFLKEKNMEAVKKVEEVLALFP